MITDIFSRRYAHHRLWDAFRTEDGRFLNQAATMIIEKLWPGRDYGGTLYAERPLKSVHDQLALELGVQSLSDRFYNYKFGQNTQVGTYTYVSVCRNFLLASAPTNAQDADEFIKDRLSFVELAFRLKASEVAEENRKLPLAIAQAKSADKRSLSTGVPTREQRTIEANTKMNKAFADTVCDLNERLRLAQYPLSYHNGLIQLSQDETADAQIADPFWGLVGTHPWPNVDEQMKEAIDRRDGGDYKTAAFHAVCALESTVKIISNERGWTRGTEIGAANYIDNLVSKPNGRYIDVWESEMLKTIFSDVRNPFAHGPGGAPMPAITSQQADWAIDTAMAWIKSLIRRL